MRALTPFRVRAERKERVWGGKRLGEHDPPYGEAWIVCDQNFIETGALQGQTLAKAVENDPIDILGRAVFEREGAVFPLLIKLLDPVDWLSIQVHPDDALARAIEGEGFRGKTEAWYVLEASSGAELIAGVRSDNSPEDVSRAIRSGSLDPMLERHVVRAGDALLVEAGLIHALGPGVLIYEVQQSSDLTYRVSDWGRPASAGRALHIDQSVRSAKPSLRPQFYPAVEHVSNGSFSILGCQFFHLELIGSDGGAIDRDTGYRSFHAVTVIDGAATLKSNGSNLELCPYESAIVPGVIGDYALESREAFRALVSSVP